MPILSNFPSGAKQENASATVAGIAKLYTATGTSTDGAMTQKAVTDALGGKAASSHTHDDRYFTESEMNTKLSSKSDTSHTHDNAYLKLAGGTLTGDLTVGSSKIQTNGYVTGTWLRATAENALSTAATKFAVIDGSGWVYYRTKDQLLSDLGLTGVTKITVDSAMSASSTNPVQNKVVTEYVDSAITAAIGNAIAAGY